MTGFNAGVLVGVGSGDMTFNRGSSLPDVQVARSDSEFWSYMASAEVSYGIEISGKWTVSPMARLKWFNSERDGYSESDDLAFSAEYDSATEAGLVLDFGLDQRFVLNEQNAFRAGIGVEWDIQYSEPEVAGTSNIPGMTSFEISSDMERNNWRGFASLEHQFSFSTDKLFSTSVYIQAPFYGSEPVMGGSVSISFSF